MSFFYTKKIHSVTFCRTCLINLCYGNAEKPIKVGKLKNDTMASSRKKSNKTQKKTFVSFKPRNLKIKSQLDKKYRFDNFIKSDSNQDALSAGFFVSSKPGEKLFNPLLIYGGSGLGKTYLVNAIGNEIKERFPKKNVLCVTSNFFSMQCIKAIENNNQDRFVNWLQLIDVFILEDIQFLSGQTIAQELILDVLDTFFQKGKQIIITSDRMLTNMKDINPQLLSRFKTGIMVALHQPEYQAKITFLKNNIITHQ